MSDRERFHRLRGTGLGGSDIAALLNVDLYGRTAADLYREKRAAIVGVAREDDEAELQKKPWLDRGRRLEPVVRQLFQERTGHKVLAANFRRHRQHRFMCGHPDGIIVPAAMPQGGDVPVSGARGVLEIKHADFRMWADIRTNGIPYHWQLQMQHYLMTTDLTWGMFAILNSTRWELLIIPLVADPVLQKTLLQLERQFWEDHVVAGVEPTVELKLPAPEDERTTIPQALAGASITKREDADWAKAMANFLDANDLIEEAEALRSGARQRLQELAGTPGQYVGGGGKLVWYTQPGRTSFDAKAFLKLGPLDPLKVLKVLSDLGIQSTRLQGLDLKLDPAPFTKQGQSFDTVKVFRDRTTKEGS